jgi:hypothetical protein
MPKLFEMQLERIGISYPALLYWPGYLFIAANHDELAAGPRSALQEMREIARAGDTYLLDSNGNYFQILDWLENQDDRRGRILDWITRTSRVEPALQHVGTLNVSDFARAAAHAVRSRFECDTGPEAEYARDADDIEKSISYSDVIQAIDELI